MRFLRGEAEHGSKRFVDVIGEALNKRKDPEPVLKGENFTPVKKGVEKVEP